MWIIYCHTNTTNGKKYIGQTKKTLEERWKGHLLESKNKNAPGYNSIFKKAIRKYGSDIWLHETLQKDIENQEQANERETYWITQLGTYGEKGYNMTPGGAPTESSICEWMNHKVYKIELQHVKTKHYEGDFCFHCARLVKMASHAIDMDDADEENSTKIFTEALIQGFDYMNAYPKIGKIYLDKSREENNLEED